MKLKEAIDARRSVRGYTGEPVAKETVTAILEAGLKAPSGKNGQPWRFIAIQDDKELLRALSKQTVYESFVGTADCLLVVLLDKSASYHYIKDCQAVGACIENMLLTAADLGIGACWIGEILGRDASVKKLLALDNSVELMAVIALGYGADSAAQPDKKTLGDCLLRWQ